MRLMLKSQSHHKETHFNIIYTNTQMSHPRDVNIYLTRRNTCSKVNMNVFVQRTPKSRWQHNSGNSARSFIAYLCMVWSRFWLSDIWMSVIVSIAGFIGRKAFVNPNWIFKISAAHLLSRGVARNLACIGSRCSCSKIACLYFQEIPVRRI